VTLKLFELEGRDGLRYSLFSWRSRLALAHKGLKAELVPVKLHEKERIAFSGGRTVPILCDGERVVRDSWAIACYLDERNPDAASLFGGGIGRGLTRSFADWVDRAIVPQVVSHLAVDGLARVHDDDRAYFRSSMEKAFGATLEHLAEDRERWVDGFRKTLAPLRRTLRDQPFVAGEQSAYADFVLYSVFRWAEVMSAFALLAPDDEVLRGWSGRIADLAGRA